MDRIIVYPGAIPLDTDILNINRNVMVALGFLMNAVFGSNTVADGLACLPTSPSSLSVTVGPGCMTQFGPVDANAYGSLAADSTDNIVRMGSNLGSTSFTFVAPQSVGQTINYLIEAAFLESDTDPVVLPIIMRPIRRRYSAALQTLEMLKTHFEFKLSNSRSNLALRRILAFRSRLPRMLGGHPSIKCRLPTGRRK